MLDPALTGSLPANLSETWNKLQKFSFFSTCSEDVICKMLANVLKLHCAKEHEKSSVLKMLILSTAMAPGM